MEMSDTVLSKGDDSCSEASLVSVSSDHGGASKAAVHHTPLDLVSLASQIQEANQFVRATATNKLLVILEQMRSLQKQAREILQESVRDKQLHEVHCNFVKRPGHTYHLYKKSSGELFFSMLSKEEWGRSLKHEFCGSYYLGHDYCWTSSSDVERRTNDVAAIEGLLSNNNLMIQLEHTTT